nr:uncharacterized protein LOC109150426 [Ipomoea batatas]
MLGLDPKVVVHCLVVKKRCRPVKQAQRRFRPELIPSIEAEVNKFIEAGFIRKVKYPTWISNIVPMHEKNGQIHVCIDFQDLDIACSKDDFYMPCVCIFVLMSVIGDIYTMLDDYLVWEYCLVEMLLMLNVVEMLEVAELPVPPPKGRGSASHHGRTPSSAVMFRKVTRPRRRAMLFRPVGSGYILELTGNF